MNYVRLTDTRHVSPPSALGCWVGVQNRVCVKIFFIIESAMIWQIDEITNFIIEKNDDWKNCHYFWWLWPRCFCMPTQKAMLSLNLDPAVISIRLQSGFFVDRVGLEPTYCGVQYDDLLMQGRFTVSCRYRSICGEPRTRTPYAWAYHLLSTERSPHRWCDCPELAFIGYNRRYSPFKAIIPIMFNIVDNNPHFVYYTERYDLRKMRESNPRYGLVTVGYRFQDGRI